jgi:hypothetical protein
MVAPNSDPIDANRRQSRRWPEFENVSGDLRWSGRSVAAHVVDKSTDGMAVEVPGPLPVHAGERVLVRTSTGVTEGVVTHTEPRPEGTRVGLQRLRDFSLDEFAAWRWLLGLGPRPFSRSWEPSKTRPSVVIWGLFATFVVGLGWYLLNSDTLFRARVIQWLGLNG